MSCAYSDGSSISLLEAMASGLPVIVTNGAGNQEWVSHGINGWLVPAGDIEAFVQSLLMVADIGTVEFERISFANKEITRNQANWDKNFNLLLNAYDRIEKTKLSSSTYRSR
jgi:glycosyltransferase involved in cell wall biosynthesis